ncbi:MAG: InlB B-repeat-containing protein [Treponema sp.]|nr:InlB B-repeat-containing protein [Treponema sp.]
MNRKCRKIAAVLLSTILLFSFIACNNNAEATYSVTIASTIENGSVSANKTTKVAAGTAIRLTAEADDGYVFEGFTVTDADGNAITVTEGTFTMPESNVTVSASFKLIEYTVTVASATNGSVTVDKTSAASGATVTITITPSDGYELDSLSVTGADNSDITVTENAFIMPSQNVSVSATFKATASSDPASGTGTEPATPVTYTVTFNANDGSQSPATGSQTFTAGTAQALKTAAALSFTKRGYIFAGWAATNDATSAAYEDGASYTATGNITLYAVWIANTYTVTFNANYPEADPATGSQTFTAGTAQNLKTASDLGFSRSGYTFAGWAATNDATSAAYEDGASYTATGNITLYAVWRPKALSSISVTTAPTKVLYFAGSGESLAIDGMVVTATYDNGSTATVTGATTSGFDSASAGIKTLTVSYTEDGVTKTTTTPYYVAASDALTQTVVSNGTKTINGTSYDLVKFGDFPQTIAGTEVTSYSETTLYNGWYLGSDGYFYEACSAVLCDYENTNITCSDGTVLVSGRTYYFKVKPIEWRVLTTDYNSTGKKLILAEKALTSNIPYYYSESLDAHNRGGATGIYGNNYMYSQIRAYLNGLSYYNDSNEEQTAYNNAGFLQKAFSASARNLIHVTEVDNTQRSALPDVYEYENEDTYACANTNDKIFLLSEREVTKSSYGFAASSIEDSNRIRQTTDYAKANKAFQSSGDGEGCGWLLRSCYVFSNGVYSVSELGNEGDGYLMINTSSYSICPALSISFE